MLVWWTVQASIIISPVLCKWLSFAHLTSPTTRYLHVLQPEVDAAVSGRRSSVPAVSSSSVACAPPDRRGSEPSPLQAEVTSRQECSRPEDVVNTSNDDVPLAAAVAVGQSQGIKCFHFTLASIFSTLKFFYFFFLPPQVLTLISVVLGNWTRTQKLLRHVMEKLSRFAF